MPGLWVALRATFLYFLIVFLGMIFIRQLDETLLDTFAVLTRYWVIEAVLSALCLYYVVRYFTWSGAGFGKVNWRAIFYLLPSYLVLVAIAFPIIPKLIDGSLGVMEWQLLALLTLTTFLIGFSEEVMFRGILLRGALNRLPAVQAMLLSAVAFALLHTINLFGSRPGFLDFHQLGFTFLIGFALAPVALKVGNLWPLIIWHWLWDLALFSGAILNTFNQLVVFGILLQVVVSFLLWTRIMRNE